MKNNNDALRARFATRLGVIATAVGSAVGLGNIWRFPYEAGVHGGGAFLLVYIAFIIVLGLPVICAEFALGRATRRGIFGAFRVLAPGSKWPWVGWLGVLGAIMILSFYSVVAGWTMEYLFRSVAGMLQGQTDAQLHEAFAGFTTGWRPVMWTVAFLLLNYAIIVRGVQRGIERMSNVMTPMLFVLMIAFCINSLTLGGAREGLEFLFKPDFGAITPGVVIGAMGQAFFSLSLGLGVLLTYASYFNRRTDMVRSAAVTAGLDTVIAILAGVMIFPAVFTYGVPPDQGPTLVFEVLPSIFNRMPLGVVWSSLFFLMLLIASLTSTISMGECVIAFLTEELGMTRRRAAALTVAVAVAAGTLCALSFSYLSDWTLPIVGRVNFFNWLDYCSSNILLPLGGMLIAWFTGWRLDRATLRRELDPDGRRRGLLRAITFSLRYIAPTLIAIIFIVNL